MLQIPVHRFINIYKLDNCEKVNAALIDAIRSEGGSNSQKSNLKGYMTDWHLKLDHNAEPYNYFFDFLNQSYGISMMNLMNTNILPSNANLGYTMDSIWGGIYGNGDWCKSHIHPPNQLSWCYYLQMPDDAPPLVFDDVDYKIKPVVGNLITFPGWMFHSVPKNESQQERIVLAGNLKINY